MPSRLEPGRLQLYNVSLSAPFFLSILLVCPALAGGSECFEQHSLDPVSVSGWILCSRGRALTEQLAEKKKIAN